MLDLAVNWGLELTREELGLKEVIVLVKLRKLMANMSILLCHELIEFFSDFIQEKNEKFTVLESEGLDVMLKVAWGCEFVLELFAPFG